MNWNLGVDTKDNNNELNDKEDKSNLVESIKSFIKEYEHTYSKNKTQDNNKHANDFGMKVIDNPN